MTGSGRPRRLTGAWPRSRDGAGDGARDEPGARRARLGGAPPRAARRRAPDGRGRLPGPAQLLDRLAPGGAPPGPDGRAPRRTARCRPTWPTSCAPGDRLELRGPDRRLLRLGGRAGRARCCWSPAGRASCPLMAMLRHRAARREHRCRRACCTRRAPTTRSSTATELERPGRRGGPRARGGPHPHPRASRPAGRGYRRRIDRAMLAEVAWPPVRARGSSSAARPAWCEAAAAGAGRPGPRAGAGQDRSASAPPGV